VKNFCRLADLQHGYQSLLTLLIDRLDQPILRTLYLYEYQIATTMMRLAMLLPLVALWVITMMRVPLVDAAVGFRTLLHQQQANRAAAQRNLQVLLAILCVDGNVNFDEGSFESVAFDAQFEPNCTCSTVTNEDQIIADLDLANTPQEELIATINEVLDIVEGVTQYSCANACETCFEGGEFCGILESSKSYTFGLGPGNFTDLTQLLELVNVFSSADGNLDAFAFLIEDLQVDIGFCLTYTTGESGTVCVAVETDESLVTGTVDKPCELSYNGVACDSCSFDFATDCITASCDVHGVSNIDTCAELGLEGPFVFFKAYNNPSTDTVTLGNCDALSTTEAPVSAPTAPTTEAPASAPTAPTTEAPASSPGGEGGDPSATMTEAPMSAPTANANSPDGEGTSAATASAFCFTAVVTLLAGCLAVGGMLA